MKELHRLCACDHEENAHDANGACRGTVDGESDCKCVSFCFDGRFYDESVGKVVNHELSDPQDIKIDG